MTTYSNDLLGLTNGLSLRESGIKDGFEWVDLDEVKPQEAAVRLAPGDFALKNQVLPIRIDSIPGLPDASGT